MLHLPFLLTLYICFGWDECLLLAASLIFDGVAGISLLLEIIKFLGVTSAEGAKVATPVKACLGDVCAVWPLGDVAV